MADGWAAEPEEQKRFLEWVAKTISAALEEDRIVTVTRLRRTEHRERSGSVVLRGVHRASGHGFDVVIRYVGSV